MARASAFLVPGWMFMMDIRTCSNTCAPPPANPYPETQTPQRDDVSNRPFAAGNVICVEMSSAIGSC